MIETRDLLSPFFRVSYIPHYYGDYVRQLFLASAILSAVAIPIWGDLIPFGTLFQITCSVVLVVLAGLMNPRSKLLMLSCIIFSTLGILVLENAAISLYSVQSFALFVVREITTLLLVFALYFSVKTFRAMSLEIIGKV